MRAISCRSCDQAWGIYGFAECYRATGDPVYLNASRRLMVYLWPRLPADLVPFWNIESPLSPTDARDSSAAAALASGLLSLATIENDPTLANIWQNRAVSILESLWQTYTNRDTNDASLLLPGSRSQSHNIMDHHRIYGDYYFVEALMRLAKPTLLL